MRVVVVPCFSDNYSYLIHQEGRREAVVVDPAEAGPVLAALAEHGLELTAVLDTHHHWDHVGGNEELCDRFGHLPVYGHASDAGRIPRLSEQLSHDDTFQVAGLSFRALHVPGHTSGALAYVTGDAVFSGDTLFVAGCGRLFEGTPAQMYESLNGRLGALPEATRVFCGHEYTENNLRFALSVEPDNQDVRAMAARVAALRARGEPSVPSLIGDEKRINPFLRCESAVIRHRFADASDPVEVLARLRALKDDFQ